MRAPGAAARLGGAGVPLVSPPASEGRIGKYRLIKRLAVGGMADIFLAQQWGPRGYERTVVVKTIRADLVEDEDLIHMLIEEARIASCLHHDAIVEVVEVGEEAGTHYLVMEFIFGRDLGQIRDRCHELGWRIPYEHTAAIIGEVLDALQHAHHEATFQGKPLHVIHRDVSPQNVLVGFDGSVKLLDFGLAKAAAQISRTRAGVLKGKYAYMSPEQVNFKGVDHRADLFSTGVVLWEMLTQRRLFFRASEYDTVQAVVACQVPFPRVLRPDVPWNSAWVAYRALRKSARWRYRDASTMRQSLLRDDERDRDAAKDALGEWMQRLFDKELAQRDMALTRARNDPPRHRQIMDAGFELLDEVTDPDLRFRPAPPPPDPAADAAVVAGLAGLVGSLLGTWRWFALVLASLVFLSVAAGVYIGSAGVKPDHGYLHVISDVPGAVVKIGDTDVGTAPVGKVPVMPGLHRIRGRYHDQERVLEVRVSAGENRVVKLRFEDGPGP
jgi:serine/threonine protein kinase